MDEQLAIKIMVVCESFEHWQAPSSPGRGEVQFLSLFRPRDAGKLRLPRHGIAHSTHREKLHLYRHWCFTGWGSCKPHVAEMFLANLEGQSYRRPTVRGSSLDKCSSIPLVLLERLHEKYT